MSDMEGATQTGVALEHEVVVKEEATQAAGAADREVAVREEAT